jgi:hypothetical protein
VLTGLSQSAVMALTAEQHAQLAAAYERAAADFLLPPEKRAEYAKKADWFRLLAGLAAKNEKRAPRALRCFTRAGKRPEGKIPDKEPRGCLERQQTARTASTALLSPGRQPISPPPGVSMRSYSTRN